MTTINQETEDSQEAKSRDNTWKIATALLAVISLALTFFLWQEHSKLSVVSHEKRADFDHSFIDIMIPHQQQGIDEAEQAVTRSQRPELKALAEKIIKTQQEEIDQMMQWRKQWFGLDGGKSRTPQ